MMSRTGKQFRLLALSAFGCLAIACGPALAQGPQNKAQAINRQSAKAADTVDPTTLNGKLIMGYQGWFNCPGDGTKVGWWHWFTGPDPTVDFLPNAADYPTSEQCVTTMLDAAGNSVNLFSDANPATVETQFAWMQQYGLDGVALQRFSVDLLAKQTLDARNIVLATARQRPRVLRHVRSHRVAQRQAEHRRAGLEKAGERGSHQQSGLPAPSRASPARRLGPRLLGPPDDSIRYVEVAQIARQGKREVRRHHNHGRRAVVLADKHARRVLRPRMAEGLAQARRAEPMVGRPLHQRYVGG